jgi:hypothetical protein
MNPAWRTVLRNAAAVAAGLAASRRAERLALAEFAAADAMVSPKAAAR